MKRGEAVDPSVSRCNAERRAHEKLTAMLAIRRRAANNGEWDALWEGWFALGNALRESQKYVALGCAPWFEVQQ